MRHIEMEITVSTGKGEENGAKQRWPGKMERSCDGCNFPVYIIGVALDVLQVKRKPVLKLFEYFSFPEGKPGM